MSAELLKPALSGAIGTTFMTVFSSLVSEKKKRQFREHELLSDLLNVFPIEKNNRIRLALAGHYSTGMAFNIANQWILRKMKAKPTLLNGILLGALNGAIGIAVWKTIFEIHPSPPKISLKRHLAHLLLAHLIFGTLSNAGMRILEQKSKTNYTAI